MVSSTHEHHDFVRRQKFSAPVQRQQVEAEWVPRGFSCDLFVDPPGREWNDFVHHSDELVTVVSGSMQFTIDTPQGTDTIDLGPGDEVFIPAGSKHSTKNTGKGETRWLYGYG